MCVCVSVCVCVTAQWLVALTSALSTFLLLTSKLSFHHKLCEQENYIFKNLVNFILFYFFGKFYSWFITLCCQEQAVARPLWRISVSLYYWIHAGWKEAVFLWLSCQLFTADVSTWRWRWVFSLISRPLETPRPHTTTIPVALGSSSRSTTRRVAPCGGEKTVTNN